VKFVAADKEGNQIVCLLFGKALEYKPLITGNGTIEVIGAVELNEWNNKSNIQIKVREIS
ncbi:MAG: hypothetical protein GX078_03855, partial [Clostridiales bacterium]|nr:hypothetical protein [Clostridiales bacterium]